MTESLDSRRQNKAQAEALVALMSTGVSEADCLKVIQAIAAGMIAHIRFDDELERLQRLERRYIAMCLRLGDCARRHGVIQDGGLYLDQVIIGALDEVKGFRS